MKNLLTLFETEILKHSKYSKETDKHILYFPVKAIDNITFEEFSVLTVEELVKEFGISDIFLILEHAQQVIPEDFKMNDKLIEDLLDDSKGLE